MASEVHERTLRFGGCRNWWFVPGYLSLCRSLKGSSLSSSGALCLLTALLGCLSPSQGGILSSRDRGNSSWRVFVLAVPHQSLQKGLEMQKSAEILLDALAAFKGFKGS